jgi:creatinine amidohydrolase/Fe(II)-dependent formamide hydrolase-like protein/7-cyano-7-deazaguanine synthase in queuosine biosynthesis
MTKVTDMEKLDPHQSMLQEANKRWDSLGVIKRLEVGPVALKPNRLAVPYRIVLENDEDSTELVYRFEEDVFTPHEPDSQNLASMIGAQVALNYGLFCDEIVFHGLYDRHDRLFLTEMARNTAREIYVKKLLEPNPFLLPPFNGMPLWKRKHYLRANLFFSDEDPFKTKGTPPWGPDRERVMVLSSGGKDSLLSYGLLKEIGMEVHPVFINESGRHWFTAINAYRYFSQHIPGTARVWTNSDRVFNWMLRHLPFIRDDFSEIRSDEYPIRLWTVAVFLFGVLPIMKKRAIGYLVIGDEFDTTNKTVFQGIPHYDGLYDQSQFFDQALTRYFHRKKWGVNQFSVLRPLSELLIEKTLLERYPELQTNQISCHAAHKAGNRIRPCGKCEKCRRIVAMILALDGDPTHCGYTSLQIETCLKNLPKKGVHQEAKAVEHLGHLLNKKEFISTDHIGESKARKRPDIMKLRFDPRKSPLDGIPKDLRKPLYRIMLDHSEGAVKRRGRRWIDFDLMTDPEAKMPYPFWSPNRRDRLEKRTYIKSKPSIDNSILGELAWPEAQKRFKEVDVALLPVGAIEQHGPHLPLDSDAFDAEYLAQGVAKACKPPKPIVLPLVPYGVSYHHEDFAGTISINPETLSQLVYDIGMSAVHHGITKLVIINGHGGNSPALHFAAQMINRDAHIFTCVDTGETSDPDIFALTETPNDVHAGEIETSTTLASRPHLVKLNEARKFIPRFSIRYLDFTSKRSVGWYAHTSKISPTGILGDPTRATAEKGKRLWELMVKHLVEFVEDLKTLTLDEIYQRRY